MITNDWNFKALYCRDLCRPGMWFHHVRQSPDDRGRTIAVNYCKDQTFRSHLRFYKFYETLKCWDVSNFWQGMTCSLTSSMLTSTSCSQFITRQFKMENCPRPSATIQIPMLRIVLRDEMDSEISKQILRPPLYHYEIEVMPFF